MSELEKRLRLYEFPASVCGDRLVLKLTVEQAIEVIENVIFGPKNDLLPLKPDIVKTIEACPNCKDSACAEHLPEWQEFCKSNEPDDGPQFADEWAAWGRGE